MKKCRQQYQITDLLPTVFLRAFSLSAATELPQTQPVGLCFLSSVCFLGVYLRASLAFRVIIAKIVAMIVATLLHKTMMKNVR